MECMHDYFRSSTVHRLARQDRRVHPARKDHQDHPAETAKAASLDHLDHLEIQERRVPMDYRDRMDRQDLVGRQVSPGAATTAHRRAPDPDTADAVEHLISIILPFSALGTNKLFRLLPRRTC